MKRALVALLLALACVSAARAQGSTNYPTSLDTGATLPQAVDNKFTYLSAAVTNSATTLTVASTAGVPASGVLQVDSELMSYTTTTGTTFTVTRGFSGTGAAAHALNAAVRFPLVSAHVNGTRGAVLALEAKLGTGASDAASASTGHVLKKNGDGTTGWGAAPGGGSGAPGGSDTQVQFNDAGSFGGDAGLSFNKTTDALAVGGALSIGGALSYPVAAVSADTTLGVTHYFLAVDASAAARTLTLPPCAAGTSGRTYFVKKSDSSANTVTVERAGTDTIDGGTSLVFEFPDKARGVVCGGSGAWYVQ